MVGLDGSLYAGGQFDFAGEEPTANIARWDGMAWYPLGSGHGMNGAVRALTHGPNGSLYAGGEFSAAGDVVVGYIAAGDGAARSPLDRGTTGSVLALAAGPEGSPTPEASSMRPVALRPTVSPNGMASNGTR